MTAGVIKRDEALVPPTACGVQVMCPEAAKMRRTSTGETVALTSEVALKQEVTNCTQ